MEHKRVLADTWYATRLNDLSISLQQASQQRFPKWLLDVANRSSIIQGLLVFWLSRNYSLIVTTYNRGWVWPFLILEFCFTYRQRRIIFLEFLSYAGHSRSFLKKLIHSLLLKWIFRPVLRKTMRLGQVLTHREIEYYAQIYQLPPERFVFIPWPQRFADDTLPEFSKISISTSPEIVSSGRTACDWYTLFKAAEGQDWPLRIICSKYDLRQVMKLNHDHRAVVLSEISREEHYRYLCKATIYVLCLYESGISAGQIRIMDAIRAGTPIIATSVRGIDGYLVHGETAHLVAPGDYLALRMAIRQLLDDPAYRQRLAKNAFERANWTFEEYINQIKNLILQELGDEPKDLKLN